MVFWKNFQKKKKSHQFHARPAIHDPCRSSSGSVEHNATARRAQVNWTHKEIDERTPFLCLFVSRWLQVQLKCTLKLKNSNVIFKNQKLHFIVDIIILSLLILTNSAFDPVWFVLSGEWMWTDSVCPQGWEGDFMLGATLNKQLVLLVEMEQWTRTVQGRLAALGCVLLVLRHLRAAHHIHQNHALAQQTLAHFFIHWRIIAL